MDPSKPDATVADTEPSVDARGGSAVPGSYRIGAVLGRGGMGEVVAATDERIGRGVALKRMRGPGDIDRFLREARIQARLDHPAIVPVHDLGTDADGRPYFTMKQLAGITLAATLDDPGVKLQRLLRVFVEVCRAIELAHSRGIIHRDLKPANIMLGRFGEVYVIDWGVARVLAEADAAIARDVATLDGETVGGLLGTPGFMAPEQARGEPAEAPADVYALGCILFEILVRAPLHPRGMGALASTLATPTASPALRRSDVAPELDAACVAALDGDPARRPTVHELADRVERYLDGDRDLERRRALARELVARATAARTAGDRAAAIRDAGRALALDPESDAAALVTALMVDPPREVPAEVAVRIRAHDDELGRAQYRTAAKAFCAFFAFVPLAFVQGIQSWPTFLTLYAAVTAMVVGSSLIARTPRPDHWFGLLGNAVVAALCTRIVGPVIFVPALICVQTMALAMYPRLGGRPLLPLVVMGVALLAPVALEAAGILAPTWDVVGDAIVSRSPMLDLGGSVTEVFLILSSLVTMVTIGLFARALVRDRQTAYEAVEIQAWQLRQLLPPV